MYAVCPAGEGHVDAIVDDNARSRSSTDSHEVGDERRQVDGLEIAFPNLDEIDFRSSCPLRLIDEAPASRVKRRALSAERGGPVSSPTETPERSRLVIISARSTNPTTRFTTPRPLTPPRTKLLVTIERRSGHVTAK